MIRLPGPMRYELLLSTLIYGGLWLSDLIVTVRRQRRTESAPEPPQEVPREDPA